MKATIKEYACYTLKIYKYNPPPKKKISNGGGGGPALDPSFDDCTF